MRPVPAAADVQHIASVRVVVERLAENLNRPDPDLVAAQVLADRALRRLRTLEQAAISENDGPTTRSR